MAKGKYNNIVLNCEKLQIYKNVISGCKAVLTRIRHEKGHCTTVI
jgi:hypothetical protein